MSTQPDRKHNRVKRRTAALNPKQQLFVDEYMKDRNATQAYIRAGYSPNGASTHAARLVANGPVSAEIAKRVEEYSRTAGLSVVALLERAKLIAFSDIRQLFDENGKLLHPTQWPEGVAAAVAGFDLDWGTGEDGEPLPVGRAAKVRLCDKPDALRTLLGFLRGSVIAEQSLPELDATIPEGHQEPGPALGLKRTALPRRGLAARRAS